ncbi:hypothetical protein [Frateuria terrea]|uniref:Uncharacterized protein n=1 Tax=Frateuria terrea TaxID=529704 RepID=A0A1H6ZP16_9GAMM|nr:hypothetical protein [Frateuria terrea]SEJ55008.1 hypothetical protein SAMN04487997_0180 [Frateuria terrea]SFP47479.1 hypothetical protein SAMN02927913_2210 [Frateuria terrea]
MGNELQRVDVVEALASWCNEKNIGRAEYDRRCSVCAAVAEMIEAGRELRAGMDENDTRPMDAGPAKRFLAADARHRAALARIGGAA